MNLEDRIVINHGAYIVHILESHISFCALRIYMW